MTMRDLTRLLSIGLVFLQLVSMGCATKDEALNRRLVDLEATSTALAERVRDLDTKATAADARLDLLETALPNYASASFDPAAAKGFARIDTSNGTFLVSVQNIVPYIDGFKVTCTFGNPSTATYQGFKVTAKWGPRFDRKATGASWTAWHATLQEKEVTMTETLRAGAWNPHSFVVSPAKADQFGYLELSMETSQISLVDK